MKKTIRTIISVLALTGLLAGMSALASPCATQSEATVEITASPQVMILGLQGEWLTIHTDLPFASVNRSTVMLEVDGTPIEPDLLYADACGNLVAKFDQATIQGMVAPPSASLTLTGEAADEAFTGSDTILVKELGKK